MKKVKIGLIGYGNRGRLYVSFIKDCLDKVELVALCDLRVDELKESTKNLNIKHYFSNTDDFYNANLDLDLVLICSMDQYHFEHTKLALMHNYNVLLEKPISNKYEEVVELNNLAKERNLKVIVTYVLRYTMFYRKIKEIINSGRIGKIININTTENVSYWHQAHSYTRGNWRNSNDTGPMILTKCSHDMDLLYWLMGKNVSKISSFGSLSYLTTENAPENSTDYCTTCPCKDTCAFNCYRFYLNNKEWLRPMVGDDLSDEKINKFLENSQYSRCVFKCDNNVVDHQVVNIQFDDKTTASHTMNAYTRWCYRDIKVMGSKGCIEGNFEEKKFNVYDFVTNDVEVVDITNFTDDFVGHGGGDRIMFYELIDYIVNDVKTVSLTTLQESVISHEMAFASENSRVDDGKVIDIKNKL